MTILREFRPGLWLTELSLDEFDVRGVVVRGRERALVWDSLSHPRDMAPVAELLGDLPYVLVYSHADWDHVWGTGGLPAPRTVIAHDACLRRFADDVPATLAEMQAAQPGRWDDVALVPPTLTFPERMTIDLGGVTVELHHLPGHTEDCLVALIPAWGILLGGDAVEDPFPLLSETTILGDWARRLRPWAINTRVETVIPAHGAIDGRRLIRNNIAYLDALRRGNDPAVGADGDAFYAASHAENLRKTQAQSVTVRAYEPADGRTVDGWLAREWGATLMALNHQHVMPQDFAGFLALRNDTLVGVIIYQMFDDHCFVAMLYVSASDNGLGRRLLQHAMDAARAAGKPRLSLTTTNDNLPALRFYQRIGMRISAVYPGAAKGSYSAAAGVDGIPIHDEIELEMRLT